MFWLNDQIEGISYISLIHTRITLKDTQGIVTGRWQMNIEQDRRNAIKMIIIAGLPKKTRTVSENENFR